MVAWWVAALISIALNVVAYIITPRPRNNTRPEAARDIETPTAEAGSPIPVVFGTMTVKGLNVIHYGDKYQRTYEVAA